MHIDVLFFARFKEALDCDRESLTVPESVTTVAALMDHLSQRGPQWRRVLLEDKVLVAVNQAVSQSATPLQDGDEVAFYPPVTGG